MLWISGSPVMEALDQGGASEVALEQVQRLVASILVPQLKQQQGGVDGGKPAEWRTVNDWLHRHTSCPILIVLEHAEDALCSEPLAKPGRNALALTSIAGFISSGLDPLVAIDDARKLGLLDIEAAPAHSAAKPSSTTVMAPRVHRVFASWLLQYLQPAEQLALAQLSFFGGSFSAAGAAARTLGESHPETLGDMVPLACWLSNEGRYQESEQLEKEIIALRQSVLGPEHPDTLRAIGTLALDLRDQGRHHEAEPLNRRLIEVRRRVCGHDHPDTISSMDELAGSLSGLGLHEEGERVRRQAWELQKLRFGSEHPDTLTSMANLAGFLNALEQAGAVRSGWAAQ
ncbi:hypothetical protein WJX72_002383 [[Myrmecia] bisecta]|uniref:Tetratricopeptide repeat protein n=1 Tax=[Myrmecia] bisecta TaxID=41462 RepID=A0AAW1PHH3_9CHLO